MLNVPLFPKNKGDSNTVPKSKIAIKKNDVGTGNNH